MFTLNICWNFSSQIHQLISSIRFRFHPSNCMIILCNVVPWRNVSTLGASAYFLICSTACCHCSSAFASKSFLGLCLLYTTLKFCNALLYRYLYECNFPLDGIILPTGRQDNAIPKHKTLRRELSSDSLNHQKEIELGFI